MEGADFQDGSGDDPVPVHALHGPDQEFDEKIRHRRQDARDLGRAVLPVRGDGAADGFIHLLFDFKNALLPGKSGASSFSACLTVKEA